MVEGGRRAACTQWREQVLIADRRSSRSLAAAAQPPQRMAARPFAATPERGAGIGVCGFLRLPAEVMSVHVERFSLTIASVQILSFLKPEEIARFSMVCKDLRR